MCGRSRERDREKGCCVSMLWLTWRSSKHDGKQRREIGKRSGGAPWSADHTHVRLASRKRSGATRNPFAAESLSSRPRPIAVLLAVPISLRVPAFRYFRGGRGQKVFSVATWGARSSPPLPLLEDSVAAARIRAGWTICGRALEFLARERDEEKSAG